MTGEELKAHITGILPETSFDETGEFLTAGVGSDQLLTLVSELRLNRQLSFDYLFMQTCVDWKDHLMMVYYLLSKEHRHTLVIKAKINNTENPEIHTVSHIYQTANLNEREIYDLFGVKFINHPDLRRLFLDEAWPGWPLRKNYVDENMIEL